MGKCEVGGRKKERDRQINMNELSNEKGWCVCGGDGRGGGNTG